MDMIHHKCLLELNPNESAKFGVSSGIQYKFNKYEGELRWNYNIGNGFIITVANCHPVRTLQEFVTLLQTHKSFCVSGIYPDGTHQHYFIE